MKFETRRIELRKIKKNGTINKAIEEYRKWRVPMRVLLTDYLAVKSKGNRLAEAENPWAYNYKGIEGHEVESGVSVDESLFRFAAMSLKGQKPTDVINAAFFANKRRNDGSFEIGYVLPLFMGQISNAKNILVVNPSPDMICEIENSGHQGKHYYAVTDETISNLYKIQFPEASFMSFGQMENIHDMDAVLITNRDQKAQEAQILLRSLFSCKKNAFVLALIPNAWFDNPVICKAYDTVEKAGFSLKKMLIVDTKATVSTPRKKSIVLFENDGKQANIEVSQSSFDEKTREFKIADDVFSIKAEEYLKSQKTILACYNKSKYPVQINKAIYKKAKEYRFSKEISVFYNIYADRKNRYAGIVYYRELIDINLKTWGKKLSAIIEKGLRAETEEKVIASISGVLFNERIYPVIRSDIENKYIAVGEKISLKTIWFYCWPYLLISKKYDHKFMESLLRSDVLSDYLPQVQAGSELLELVANSLNTDVDSIPYKVIEQIGLILETALKHKLLVYNPLDKYVAEYTRRATERQQDVRNALVKKHFSNDEEIKIIKAIVEQENLNGKIIFKCTGNSLLLATGIRMFTGMACREVAALTWGDYKNIDGSDAHQFMITKFVDSKGKVLHGSDKENWKRYRIVPVVHTLSYLLDQRRKYLLELGINGDYLNTCPIVLQEERITDMKQGKKINYCKPAKISKSENKLIKKAQIPENNLVLPDDRNELSSDFNRYHGDIFLSNFRHKANHKACLTMGEINYVIGVRAPDTFSRHYCDYTNDFIQLSIIQKLARWEVNYERMIKRSIFQEPGWGETIGNVVRELGPYRNGTVSVDLVIENNSESDIKILAACEHGIEVNLTVYGG